MKQQNLKQAGTNPQMREEVKGSGVPERVPLPQDLPPASRNMFSKVADMKIPDSPPPEKNEESEPSIPGAKPGMSKFEQLMKAAVSIKTAQLDQKKKKFEKLPTFLKAGLYYSNKLECVRSQSDFHVKLFALELIRNEGLREYYDTTGPQRQYERACRKFEEALSIFRYYVCRNPKWQEQGVDDDEIREVDEQGKSEYEKAELRKIKLGLYLNIAACNIKVKDYETAVAACNEALKLDPYNVKALYRRARAVALPINSGVEDFRTAMVDLKRIVEVIDPSHQPSLKELKRLQNLVDVNRQREKDTYSKMFTASQKGISDYIEEETKRVAPVTPYKTVDDLEYEQERKKMDERIRLQMQAKLKDLSFEVLPEEERKHYPEMDDLQVMIDKAEESYKIFRKTGRGKDAKIVRQKLEEALFSKLHLFHVMNLDFTKPTAKLIDMAQKNNIDLTDPNVIEEFQRIQLQNLEDIRRLKDGKKPLTDEEMKEKLQNLREEEHRKATKLLEETQRRKDESVRRLIEGAFAAQSDATSKLNLDEQRFQSEQIKHYIVIAIFMTVWVFFIIYQNFDLTSQEGKEVNGNPSPDTL